MEEAPAILIVEDDELVQSFLSRALADLAGPVSTCADGRTALAAAAAQPFGLILLDGLLPDLHGLELAKQLVTTPAGQHSAICFVSGMLRQPEAMRSGVAALPKPLRVRELLQTATDLLHWQREQSSTARADDRLAVLDALGTSLLVG